jgi:hypothetical protein
MRTNAFILASVALFALGVSSATAGPCTTEIDNLVKVITAKDAGSGPTPGASAGSSTAAPSNEHPATAAMSEAAKGTATSAEDARRQTAGQSTAAQQGTGGPPAQHPPTAAMSQATQGQTAPVTTGEHPPTAAMSETTRTQAAPPASASPGNTGEASAALNRARMLDQQGKEAECMEAVRQARQHAGR